MFLIVENEEEKDQHTGAGVFVRGYDVPGAGKKIHYILLLLGRFGGSITTFEIIFYSTRTDKT